MPIVTARARAFAGEGVRTHRFAVNEDGTVRVWDAVGKHFTTVHALSPRAQARIRKLAPARPKITAVITARGCDSQVWDESALDANIYADGVKVGAVTLVREEEGARYAAWGDMAHWASSELMAWMDRTGSTPVCIEDAVNEAAEAAE